MPHLFLVLSFALLFQVGAGAQVTEAPTPRAPAFEFHLNPIVDLLFCARSAASQGSPPAVAGWSDVAAAIQTLEKTFGGSLAWGILARVATDGDTAAEFARNVRSLPETFRSVSGEQIAFREHAEALAAAISTIEPDWLSNFWPARRSGLLERKSALDASLQAASGRWIPFVLASLNMTDPQPMVPVYLVTEAPHPGAATYRTRSGGACFIAIGMEHHPDLLETIVHEMMHAFDVSTQDEPTALQSLRSALRAAGVPPTDRRMRDLPHLIIFVQAAETVRRHLDAEHVDYGHAAGVYARAGQSATVVREHWRNYLNGHSTLDEAIRVIVENATEEEKGRTGDAGSP